MKKKILIGMVLFLAAVTGILAINQGKIRFLLAAAQVQPLTAGKVVLTVEQLTFKEAAQLSEVTAFLPLAFSGEYISEDDRWTAEVQSEIAGFSESFTLLGTPTAIYLETAAYQYLPTELATALKEKLAGRPVAFEASEDGTAALKINPGAVWRFLLEQKVTAVDGTLQIQVTKEQLQALVSTSAQEDQEIWGYCAAAELTIAVSEDGSRQRLAGTITFSEEIAWLESCTFSLEHRPLSETRVTMEKEPAAAVSFSELQLWLLLNGTKFLT